MKYKAALFDLDGVLIDSETTYTGIWSSPSPLPDFRI